MCIDCNYRRLYAFILGCSEECDVCINASVCTQCSTSHYLTRDGRCESK